MIYRHHSCNCPICPERAMVPSLVLNDALLDAEDVFWRFVEFEVMEL